MGLRHPQSQQRIHKWSKLSSMGYYYHDRCVTGSLDRTSGVQVVQLELAGRHIFIAVVKKCIYIGYWQPINKNSYTYRMLLVSEYIQGFGSRKFSICQQLPGSALYMRQI